MFTIRYGKTMVSCAALAVAALLVTLVLTHTGPAKPRPAPKPPLEVELSLGTYLTTINIHNPSFRDAITLYKQAVFALPESATAPAPSAFQSVSLLPGYAVEIDCIDIAKLLADAPTGVREGFVTILARDPLDVVGVYTTAPPSVSIPVPFSTTSTQTQWPGIALQMLNIAPRIEFVPSGTLAPGQGPAGRLYEYSAKFLCYQPV
ncbi:MAG: hypothetical protein WCD04_01860 [Terriglobia bacterium]|jgi:hypothetical protein